MGLFETGSQRLFATLVAGAVSLGASGCAERYVMIQTGIFPRPMLFEDALEWTREGADVVQTMHDFETAQEAAYGSMGMLEGLHKLVPDDENGLLLLTRSWAGIAFAFMDDEREDALDHKDEQLAAYHEARARQAFKRARFFGNELVDLHAKGFKEAQRNAATLKAWLAENYTDKDRADELLWLAFSIVGRVGFDLDNPETVSELWIGIELAEQSLRLNENLEYGTGHTMIGAAQAGLQDYAGAKKHFDRALELSGGKVLTAQLTMAQRYYCPKRDKKMYFEMLNQVLAAADPLPEQRLSNTIAKRRARRYLGNKFWQEDCAFEG
jgi:tetratricopeptide (TPR) repeat protein